MFQQPNVYQQTNPYAQQNMYQYNMDTYLRYNMYPFEPYYGNQNYYQPFEVSFMNQAQQPQQQRTLCESSSTITSSATIHESTTAGLI